MSEQKSQPRRSALDWIEFVGNKLPEPAIIFVILAALIIGIAALGDALGWEVTPVQPRIVSEAVVDAAVVADHDPKPPAVARLRKHHRTGDGARNPGGVVLEHASADESEEHLAHVRMRPLAHMCMRHLTQFSVYKIDYACREETVLAWCGLADRLLRPVARPPQSLRSSASGSCCRTRWAAC